jgi:hypothetical protein
MLLKEIRSSKKLRIPVARIEEYRDKGGAIFQPPPNDVFKIRRPLEDVYGIRP